MRTDTFTAYDIDTRDDGPREIEPVIASIGGLGDQQLVDVATWAAHTMRWNRRATLEDHLVARLLSELVLRFNDRRAGDPI